MRFRTGNTQETLTRHPEMFSITGKDTANDLTLAADRFVQEIFGKRVDRNPVRLAQVKSKCIRMATGQQAI